LLTEGCKRLSAVAQKKMKSSTPLQRVLMGQYYFPIYLGPDGKILAWMDPSEYNSGMKLTEHSYMKNPAVNTFEWGLARGAPFYKARVVWAGDYADPEPSTQQNLHQMCGEYTMIRPGPKGPGPRYILNHTKKLFVDKDKVPTHSYHPLPILTAEGNGRGGGDCADSPLVGSWARDEISVGETTEGFEELVFDMAE
jgi:hypothetical protein